MFAAVLEARFFDKPFSYLILVPRNVTMKNASTKERTIRKVMQGEGNFRAAGIFFRYQIPCMNFFQALV